MLEEIKVNKNKYYKVGYSPYLKQYVLAITITWIAWYERYYSISEGEYKWFDNDIDKLNHLANELYHLGISSSRFIFSEMSAENDSSQMKLFNKVFQKDIGKNSQRKEDLNSEIIQICHLNMDNVISVNPNLLYLKDKDGEFIRLYNNDKNIDILETPVIKEQQKNASGSDDCSVIILNAEEIGFLQNYSWEYFDNKIIKIKIATEFSEILIEAYDSGFIINIKYKSGKMQRIDTAKC